MRIRRYRVKVEKRMLAQLGVPLKFEKKTQMKKNKKETTEARRSCNNGSYDEMKDGPGNWNMKPNEEETGKEWD